MRGRRMFQSTVSALADKGEAVPVARASSDCHSCCGAMEN